MDPIYINAGWFVPIGQTSPSTNPLQFPPPSFPPPTTGIIGGGCSRIEYAIPGENCLEAAVRIGVSQLEMFGANPSICDISSPTAIIIPIVSTPNFVYPNVTICVI